MASVSARTLVLSWAGSAVTRRITRSATRAIGRGGAVAAQRVGTLVPVPARLGGFFAGAGVMHFVRPDFFEAVVPDWFPSARAANVVSGAAEIGLGLLTIPRVTRRRALWGLVAVTVIVFPANIDAAVNDVEVRSEQGRFVRSVGTAEGPARVANWVRLPLQLPLLWLLVREARRS